MGRQRVITRKLGKKKDELRKFEEKSKMGRSQGEEEKVEVKGKEGIER